MSDKKDQIQEDSLQGVESALTKTEQFIEDNQKNLSIATVILLAVVAGFLGFKKFMVEPQEKEALSVMFVAEQYFQKDSFELALNGDGNNWGFLDIINDYKITESANLSHYYAGISYLHLGDYEEAISHLKKFKSDDFMVGPVALGAIGDAYAEMGDNNQAITYYEKAASKNENEFTSPVYLKKAAAIYEAEGNYKKALVKYEAIKTNFPKTQEARSVEKYISRANAALGK